MTIPIPVVRSRFTPLEVLFKTPGDAIAWVKGDLAWFTSKDGRSRHPVVIDSQVCGHRENPGKACYECLFVAEGNERFCVLATALSVREPWEPERKS
jgi:hypothetical protein